MNTVMESCYSTKLDTTTKCVCNRSNSLNEDLISTFKIFPLDLLEFSMHQQALPTLISKT